MNGGYQTSYPAGRGISPKRVVPYPERSYEMITARDFRRKSIPEKIDERAGKFYCEATIKGCYIAIAWAVSKGALSFWPATSLSVVPFSFEKIHSYVCSHTYEERRLRQVWTTEWKYRTDPGGGDPTSPDFIMPPIVLDLTGSGRIETANVKDGAYFDYHGDGFAEATGWVSPDAGILIMDRNADGVLDHGSELFGSLTPLPSGQLADNGFEALAALDSNQDGKIDAQDPAYSQLMVWGILSGEEDWEAGEVATLPELGITSIDLNWTTENTTDAQGNIELYAESFQWSDGTTGLIADYGFQVEPYNSRNLPGELSMMYLEPQAAYASGMRKHTTSRLTLPPRVMERSVRESYSYSGRA
jgi:hypothetical protein